MDAYLYAGPVYLELSSASGTCWQVIEHFFDSLLESIVVVRLLLCGYMVLRHLKVIFRLICFLWYHIWVDFCLICALVDSKRLLAFVNAELVALIVFGFDNTDVRLVPCHNVTILMILLFRSFKVATARLVRVLSTSSFLVQLYQEGTSILLIEVLLIMCVVLRSCVLTSQLFLFHLFNLMC